MRLKPHNHLRFRDLYKRVIICLLLIPATIALGEPRNLTQEDMSDLKSGKIPKNARKQIIGGGFEIMIYTPRGRAARFAEAAKENYIKLDSVMFNPAKFNGGVSLEVTNLMASAYNSSVSPDDVRQISRGILLVNDEVIEADSTEYIRTPLKNAYGSEYLNIDAVFYFPLYLFDGFEDIKIVIFHSDGKLKKKLKSKDIRKLE